MPDQGTAQNAMPLAEETTDNAVVQQVEPKKKRRKVVENKDDNQKVLAAPGGGDTPIDEDIWTLREAKKEIKRSRQQLEERESRELQESEDSRAFFRAGAHPKAQTTVDTTMLEPHHTWTGSNRWAAVFFGLGVYIDQRNDDLIDILDTGFRQMSRDLGYPLKGRLND